MDKEVKKLLEERIITEFGKLDSANPMSDERKRIMDDIVKLYTLKIEEDKFENDFENKVAEQKLKEKQFDTQISEQIKDRYIKICIDAVGITLPLAFYAIWMAKGFKFEETGTYTSTTFKGLFNRFKPTIK